MVGFMEPVGTTFQSTSEERTAIMKTATTTNGRSQLRQTLWTKDG
jgi:hypothetical protein